MVEFEVDSLAQNWIDIKDWDIVALWQQADISINHHLIYHVIA